MWFESSHCFLLWLGSAIKMFLGWLTEKMWHSDLRAGWEEGSKTEKRWAAPKHWGSGLSHRGCNPQRLVYCTAPVVSSSAWCLLYTPPALWEMPARQKYNESHLQSHLYLFWTSVNSQKCLFFGCSHNSRSHSSPIDVTVFLLSVFFITSLQQ